jgi:hypothetical protein
MDARQSGVIAHRVHIGRPQRGDFAQRPTWHQKFALTSCVSLYSDEASERVGFLLSSPRPWGLGLAQFVLPLLAVLLTVSTQRLPLALKDERSLVAARRQVVLSLRSRSAQR